MDRTPAPIFRRQRPAAPPSSAIPSSSPAFGTPAHPLKPFAVNAPKAAVLPIILPPPTLRPLAFRTFTKKHSLTLTSSALQELASFIGRHCGSGWREEGLAERVLEEVARSWKNRNGGVIVEGSSKELQEILKTLQGNMSGGRITGPARGLPRGDSMLEFKENDALSTRLGLRPAPLSRDDSNTSFGMSGLGVEEDPDEEEGSNDPRAWLKIISAFEQPRLIYNVGKKHFERYVLVHHLLRGLCFNTSTGTQQLLHCYLQPPIRPPSSATATMSSTNVFSATNPSRAPPYPPPERAPSRAPFPISNHSNLLPSPTSSVVMAATTCFSASLSSCPQVASQSAT